MLGERVRQLSIEKGWTIQILAEKSKLKEETVRNIWYNKTPDPKLSTASAIADAFGITINCLMGHCSHTPQERVILRNYRSCGKHGKAIIELIARYEANTMRDRREGTAHEIPCIFPQGNISKGIVYDICKTEEIITTVPEAYTAIQMTTNDLAPAYCKGDILLFENRFPQNGEIGAFFREGKVFIRKYCEEGNSYRLKCLHKQDADIILKRMDEVDYIGTCIDVVRE